MTTDKRPISDDDLRDAIRGETRSPSAEHDETVLQTARFVANGRKAITKRVRDRWPVRVIGVAAAVLLAVGLLRILPVDTWIDDGQSLRNGSVVVSPANGAVLESPPESFSWPAQIGASGYRLVVFDAEASRLWESGRLESTELVTPAALTVALQYDASYLWLVAVEGDVTRRELGPFAFEMAGQEQ